MTTNTTKRYLVQIRYAGDMATLDRIRESSGAIKSILEGISNKQCKLAWSTSDGSTFGFFIATNKLAREIHNELNYPGRNRKLTEEEQMATGEYRVANTMPSPMRRGDHIMIIELGSDFSGEGFSNSSTWLNRH